MGNHAIIVHVTGGTDAIKSEANKFVGTLKKIGTVTGAKITHGAEEVLEGVSEGAGEAMFGGSR